MQTVSRSLTDPLDAALTLLARAHRILAQNGHRDITNGHLSLRDPGGRGMWLKKPGRGLEEVRDRDDFVLLDFEGRRLENGDACHSEWPIHAEILRARPEIVCVGHTHPYHAVLFSATDAELLALSGEASNYAGRVARYDRTAGLINTPGLGRELAGALGDAPVVLMKNHGVTYAGHSIEEAVLHGIFIEDVCRMQLDAAASGLPVSGPAPGDKQDRRFDPRGDGSSPYISTYFGYYDRRLTAAERQE